MKKSLFDEIQQTSPKTKFQCCNCFRVARNMSYFKGDVYCPRCLILITDQARAYERLAKENHLID